MDAARRTARHGTPATGSVSFGPPSGPVIRRTSNLADLPRRSWTELSNFCRFF